LTLSEDQHDVEFRDGEVEQMQSYNEGVGSNLLNVTGPNNESNNLDVTGPNNESNNLDVTQPNNESNNLDQTFPNDESQELDID